MKHVVLRLLEKKKGLARARPRGRAAGVYGAHAALALERLSRAEDGRIAYRMKRPLPDGTTSGPNTR
ncbi:hypothetical protein [Stigmatella aurantiaca]|uniref:hypothetical protein n=1 Tax=Stigmatella aurantiaca TaxID=41 RepID=UPI001FE50ADB|nr:hypothetical protein [Stigmatella aurantiaca]